MSFWRSVLALSLCIFLLLTTFSAAETTNTSSDETDSAKSKSSIDISTANSSDSQSKMDYSSYSAQYDAALRPAESVILEGGSAKPSDGQTDYYTDYEGSQGVSALSEEEKALTWVVTVPAAGLYNISIDYYPVKGHTSTIERTLTINGSLPFDNASHFTFYSNYVNETDEFEQRHAGRPMDAKEVFERARKKEQPCAQIVNKAADYLGYAIGAVYQILDPDIVILGGSVTRDYDVFREELEASAKKYMQPVPGRACRITVSEFQGGQVLLGAVYYGAQKYHTK